MKYTGERFIPLKNLLTDETAFEHFHRYYHVCEFIKNKIVVDIACGEGYGTSILANTARKVYGIDIDNSCIDHAKKKYTQKNIEFFRGNVTKIDLPDNSIDIIISFETIEHLDEKKQNLFLEEAKRVLQKNGTLILSTPDRKIYSERYSYKNEFHQKEFSKEEFQFFLKNYFNYISSFGQGYEIVDTISGENPEELSEIKICNWKRPLKPFTRKYLISICSNSPIEKKFLYPSIVFQVNKDFWQITDRIVKNEAHILELGEWGRRLDKEIEERDSLIRTKEKELNDVNIEREVLLKNLSVLKQARDDQEKLLNKYLKDIDERDESINSFAKSFQKTSEQILGFQKKLTEVIERSQNLQYELFQKDRLLSERDKQDEEILYLTDILTQRDIEIKKVRQESELLKQNFEKEITEKNLFLDKQLNIVQSLLKKNDERLQNIELLKRENEDKKNIIFGAEKIITELKREKQNLNKEVADKNLSLEQQSFIIDDLRGKYDQEAAAVYKLKLTIADNDKIIEEQKNLNKNFSDQFNVMNARMSEIYQSDGWKFLKKYYNIKGRLLPEDSKRYNFLKKIVNQIRGKKEQQSFIGESSNTSTPTESKNLPENKIEIVNNVIELPAFNTPLVSIVLPAYNGWHLTYKCLQSIKNNTSGVAYEVIIGDDASTDETKNIKKYIKNIVVIRNEKNLEFLHNCNNAATYAKGKYILFLNNDTEVRPNWLSSMVDLMEKDERIGMVGSKLIYPDGKLQEAGAIIWKDASGWNFGHKQDPDASEFNYVKEVDYISGASIIIRTNLWKKIGGFDELYTPAYCEDSDLAFEVRKHGYKVVYQPLSEVIHYEGYTHGTDQKEGIKGKEIKEYQRRNNEKFKEKWKETLNSEHFENGKNVFWAKDKSYNRKTILVVDHYVPHYDKDAGSKTVFQYLKLFVALGYNVKFIGDNFYKHQPYTTVLQQMGIEVLYGPYYANSWKDWIRSNHDKFDFILLNRPHISTKYIDFVRDNTIAKILYYGHDLHFIRLKRQYEIEKRKELLIEAEEWKEIEMSLFRKADIVLTPSEEEKNIILNLGVSGNVQSIKPYMFDSNSQTIQNFSKRKNILFVGGFTHVPNVDAVLWFTNAIWPLVKEKIRGLNFIIVGSNVPPEILKLASQDIIIKGFVSEAALQRLYSEIKLVVIPLRYGAGVKGKTVEAMHRGLPIVSTSIGMEGLPQSETIIKPKDNAIDFSEEIVRLYTLHEDELMRLSKKEAEYIQDRFYFEKVKSEIQTILNTKNK